MTTSKLKLALILSLVLVIGGLGAGMVYVQALGEQPALAVLPAHSADVRPAGWSPDGTGMASGSDDDTIRLWDAARGKESRALTGHQGPVSSVSWAPDGKT